jgi:hypothetical protein
MEAGVPLKYVGPGWAAARPRHPCRLGRKWWIARLCGEREGGAGWALLMGHTAARGKIKVKRNKGKMGRVGWIRGD